MLRQAISNIRFMLVLEKTKENIDKDKVKVLEDLLKCTEKMIS